MLDMPVSGKNAESDGSVGWPADMVIAFEDDDWELFPLLYSRAIWQLPVDGEPPSRLTVPTGVSEAVPGDRVALALRWTQAWERRLAHLCDLEDFDIERQGLKAYFSEWNALRDMLPQPWLDEFAESLDSDDYARWSQAASSSLTTCVRPEIQQALVEAWRAGLRSVNFLPIDAYFARRLSGRRLLLSIQTWNDTPSISALLTGWGSSA